MGKIGYCCIPMGCNIDKKKKDHLLVNRGMNKKTFEAKGLDYVSQLSILNLQDTLKILDYNLDNNISSYRFSSESIPWMSHYNISDLPQFDIISDLLLQIGNRVKQYDMRVSHHPGPFNVLSSENQAVVDKTINELNKHAELFDLMGLDQSHYYPINIHVCTTAPNRDEAMRKFCDNFKLLSESCRKRLTIENDDKPAQYSVKMLHDSLYSNIGIPIVFDQHHFNFGPKDQTMEEALRLALSTWTVTPLTHMSSPRTIEDPTCKKTAHADYIYERIETFGLDFDTEIEAKAKDLAVLKYKKDFIESLAS